MKRSEINAILRDSISFIERHHFHLPPFAFWGLDEWKARRGEVDRIIEGQLGWDITDFGSGDFDRQGLFLFTLRNGSLQDLAQGRGRLYAEKILIAREEQVTPLHFHWQKTEDIINRGGGRLLIQLYNSNDDGSQLLDTDVAVYTDGLRRVVPAGGIVALSPGESITLETHVYHSFWAEAGRGAVLAGEVSVVNDDHADNRWYQPADRLPQTTEEDESILYPLVTDYARYLK